MKHIRRTHYLALGVLALLAGLSLTSASAGQAPWLTDGVGCPVPGLSSAALVPSAVRTARIVTERISIPRPVAEQETADLYQGITQVLEEGSDGILEISCEIIYLNGVEQSRTVVETHILVPPVEQLVAVGTKERETIVASGSFLFPAQGEILRSFGYCWNGPIPVFCDGILLDAPAASPVCASDGGAVIALEEESGGTWQITIDHENGFLTRYGGCTDVTAEVGQRVWQGESLALAGEEGVTFSLLQNGTCVDPEKYLSG